MEATKVIRKAELFGSTNERQPGSGAYRGCFVAYHFGCAAMNAPAMFAYNPEAQSI
jgi:hypothetical protein